MKNWTWALNAVDKCRETAYNAKSEWAREYWLKVADELDLRYFGRKFYDRLSS